MATLITGGAGFVGMNLVEALLKRGERVVSCDGGVLPPSAVRALAPYGPHLTLLQGDILDARFVESLFAGRRITQVVHCAAITSGPDREARDKHRGSGLHSCISRARAFAYFQFMQLAKSDPVEFLRIGR